MTAEQFNALYFISSFAAFVICATISFGSGLIAHRLSEIRDELRKHNKDK